MTKQEAIQKAYGEHWEAVKDYVDENGWIGNVYYDLDVNDKDFEEQDFGLLQSNIKYRPKSLQGLETNRGWIKIESEDDLPVESIDCTTCYFDGKNYVQGYTIVRNPRQLWNAYLLKLITHYSPTI